MVNSMTGFASQRGSQEGFSWVWDLRSVNARGLDLRFRVPDWVSGLEHGLKSAFSKELSRGSVSLSLRLTRDAPAATDLAATLNPAALATALAQIAAIEDQAATIGLSLVPTRAADILAMRGVTDVTQPDTDPEVMRAALLADAVPLLAAFKRMRADEGTALLDILAGQITGISELTDRAAVLAEARKPQVADNLRAALARVLDNSEGVDAARLAQELAMLALKADVTEEIDRLKAHCTAAHALLASEGPVGRKLDFLTQEFNREANTLCSKAQDSALTTVGLDLKALIDQMREQVQNVE